MLSTKCLLLCISFIFGTKANLAPFITPCKWQDSNCILKSAREALPYLAKGVKDLDLPPGDPLHIGDVDADSIDGNLKLKFINASAIGIGQCLIVNISRHESEGKSSGSLTIDCPIDITGQYTIDGKVVLLNVQGHGPFQIKTEKIRMIVDFVLKTFKGKDGEKHYKVSSFKYKYEPLERIHISLENLFNGDKSQGDPILELLNENWKDIVAQLGGPLFNKILTNAVHIIDLLFRVMPAKELELV